MTWTTEKPTRAGFYWHKGVKSDDPIVVRVEPCGSSLGCRYPGDKILYTIPDDSNAGYHGKWSGPLEPPTGTAPPLTKEERGEIIRDELNRG